MGCSRRAGALLAPVLPARRVVIVTDATVAPLHLPALRAGLAEAGFAIATEITVPPGEASKGFAALQSVLEQMLAPVPTAGRRCWRWAAGWSATSPDSPPRWRCAACPSCRCRPACWPRWTAASAARPGSTCRSARTWSAPSTSRASCWPIPEPSPPCRRGSCGPVMPRSPSTGCCPARRCGTGARRTARRWSPATPPRWSMPCWRAAS